MPSLDLLSELGKYKQLIDLAIDETISNYACDVPLIRDAMKYSLEGGKRLRGAITLSTFESVGGIGDAMSFAIAIEMIQAYSLVHDDLPCMDDDDMRRGRPTCHKMFGEAMGVLAGDGLLTLAFEVASSSDLPADRVAQGIRVLSRGAGAAGMVGGQVLDLRLEGAAVRDARGSAGCERGCSDVRLMYRLKTGRLFEAAAKLGAVLAGAPTDTVKKAAESGLSLGFAYQILDDIDDLTQGGKEEEKETLVKRTSLEVAGSEAAASLRRSIAAAEPGWLLARLSEHFLLTRVPGAR